MRHAPPPPRWPGAATAIHELGPGALTDVGEEAQAERALLLPRAAASPRPSTLNHCFPKPCGQLCRVSMRHAPPPPRWPGAATARMDSGPAPSWKPARGRKSWEARGNPTEMISGPRCSGRRAQPSRWAESPRARGPRMRTFGPTEGGGNDRRPHLASSRPKKLERPCFVGSPRSLEASKVSGA